MLGARPSHMGDRLPLAHGDGAFIGTDIFIGGGLEVGEVVLLVLPEPLLGFAFGLGFDAAAGFHGVLVASAAVLPIGR